MKSVTPSWPLHTAIWCVIPASSWSSRRIPAWPTKIWSAKVLPECLVGNDAANWLRGWRGNDMLSGLTGDDTFDGGAGNDTVAGFDGNDVYWFDTGFGQDTLIDTDATGGNQDIVRFGAGITPASVTVSSSGMNLVLARSVDTVTVQNWFASDADKIERVEFNGAPGMVFVDFGFLEPARWR